MKKLLFIFALLVSLQAEEFVVISKFDSSLESLNKAKLKMIFLKKQKMLGNKNLVPINLHIRSKVRKSFENQVLEMSHNRLKSYWTKEHYLGHRPPLTMRSSKSILAFVKKIDGAIAYIPLSDVDKECKILYKWNEQ